MNFKFQLQVYDGSQGMTQKSMILNDIATVTFGRNYYRIYFWFMTKSEAVDKMKNADPSKNSTNYNYKTLFIIMVPTIKPEAMTKQQRQQ